MMVASALLPPIALQNRAGAAGGLDLLARRPGEPVRADSELLLDLALAEDLHRHAAPRGQAAPRERGGRHLVAFAEAGLEVAQVHRLGVRTEVLERHRLLHARTPQLAHPHVDRHLAALGARAALAPAARAGALLTAARGLAEAGALAAAHALSGAARA